jgi:hypothetical protein
MKTKIKTLKEILQEDLLEAVRAEYDFSLSFPDPTSNIPHSEALKILQLKSKVRLAGRAWAAAERRAKS